MISILSTISKAQKDLEERRKALRRAFMTKLEERFRGGLPSKKKPGEPTIKRKGISSDFDFMG